MLRLLWRVIVGLFAAMGVFAVCVVLWLLNGGISARRPPSATETWVVDRLRSVAMPRAARTKQDPDALGVYALKMGLEQYGDRCAGCHGIDGSGQSDVGQGLSPRVPDLRSATTQALTDGEMFEIIDDGVRYTGMPALDREERETWALVHFVKHLPDLTKAELDQLRTLNPKAAARAAAGRKK